jgi:catechol 2,3-dioxygenase-like lactoylglutathione lyase family enzyme
MSIVIDHVGLRASDLAASRGMYEAALAELGFTVLKEGEYEGDAYVLFGRDEHDDFSLHSIGIKPGRDRATSGAHVAFRAAVEAVFHTA